MPLFMRCLPKAGFRWPEGASLTNRDASHQRRDQKLRATASQIVEVLCHHANCPNLARDGKKRAASHEVSRALSEMFDQSVVLIRDQVLGSDPNSFAFMSGRLRVHVSWGSNIRADTYMELFHELYKARARWHESPRAPFNVKEHGILAEAIDRFHEAKGGGAWELKGLDKLAKAGGYVHDEEALEVRGPEDIANGTGPCDTTLTPIVMLKLMFLNTAIQNLNKRKEKGGDVEMNDAAPDDQEVSELRQRLSEVDLDEGTEDGFEEDIEEQYEQECGEGLNEGFLEGFQQGVEEGSDIIPDDSMDLS